jgi:hypothetical protein
MKQKGHAMSEGLGNLGKTQDAYEKTLATYEEPLNAYEKAWATF